MPKRSKKKVLRLYSVDLVPPTVIHAYNLTEAKQKAKKLVLKRMRVRYMGTLPIFKRKKK